MHISDDIISTLRGVFATFAIDESVFRKDDGTVQAGSLVIDRVVTDFDIYATDTDGTESRVATLSGGLPYSAAIVAAEWHLRNPRQLSLAL